MSKQEVKGVISSKAKLRMTVLLVAIVGMYVFTSARTGSSIPDLISGSPRIFSMFAELFPPNWGYASQVWGYLAETVQMAIIATTVAAIISIPISLLSAANLFPNRAIHMPVRFIMNVLRTIPDILLAVIFVGIFGIGVFSGIMALIIFSLGLLAKLLYETIEAIDLNPLEAIRASGGNTIQVIWYAVMPQVLPQFVSFSLYVFEVNVRASVVLGFVGAGGIGLILQQQLGFFNYPNVSTIIIIIFAAVVVIDYISNKIREGLV
ncbi:phosphonate ABC transporter, permease protein PhnE [Halalkalibacterium halodurans]|uniref:Alkylphosphonate ABC transporter permease n=1 Tax=Halalkalibacterium halodurans TaxID=86665 RepID=A0A0M0KHG4_ALKHA|nr:phosphonate ABC transporter, permease protein PhnE [Halalkalibacterium halodurans]MED4164529.1 phosphonate ABC transporter, permease protein PhnE [Halalkalibacterium halodurans]TPE68099.1 phosphonate ABC transporter, permease protein PhnE [Halalkalibacterium halodurans]